MHVRPTRKRLMVLVAAILTGLSLTGPTRAAEPAVLHAELNSPVNTLARARDQVRQKRASGQWLDVPVRVVLHEGTYFETAPVEFGPEDGGRPGAPVTYVAAKGQKVVVSGGRVLEGWRPGNVNGSDCWVTEIPEVAAGEWYFRQLFVNGQRRSRTRLPEEGFLEFTGLPEAKEDTAWHTGQKQANFKDGDITPFRNLNDVEIVALHFWIESRMPIAAVDTDESTVTFTRPSTFRLTDAHARNQYARYYIENTLEGLDDPGEWYLDRSTGMCYYIPRPGETAENTTIIAPRLTQLVRVVGGKEPDRRVRFLNFQGIQFQHCDWSLPADDAGSVQAAFEVPGAMYFENALQCSLRDCSVSNVSNYAVEFAGKSSYNRVANCELTDLGAGGVKLGHGTHHTTVHNCDIGPGGDQFHSAVGVWIAQSSDNTITHNDIHHLYYTGVSVGWTWGYREPSQAARNVIEYNHIHNIGQGFLSDMGGIYCLGVSPGTRLRHNHIHDIEAHTYGGWGLYTDEGSSYILLENNVVYRCKHSGFHQHYGSYNVLKNNIFAFGRHAQIMRTREENHCSFIFEHNIVYSDIPDILGSNWSNDSYHMDYNVYWREGGEPINFKGQTFEAWQQERKHDRHSLVADPMFVDPANGNFSLKEGSPALKMGFRPIDVSQCGRVVRD